MSAASCVAIPSIVLPFTHSADTVSGATATAWDNGSCIGAAEQSLVLDANICVLSATGNTFVTCNSNEVTYREWAAGVAGCPASVAPSYFSSRSASSTSATTCMPIAASLAVQVNCQYPAAAWLGSSQLMHKERNSCSSICTVQITDCFCLMCVMLIMIRTIREGSITIADASLY